jgi:hypothetical protein
MSGVATSSHLAATGLLSSEQPVIVAVSATASTADTTEVTLLNVTPFESPAQPTGAAKSQEKVLALFTFEC